MEETWPAHAKAESPTPENHDYEYDEAHDVSLAVKWGSRAASCPCPTDSEPRPGRGLRIRRGSRFRHLLNNGDLTSPRHRRRRLGDLRQTSVVLYLVLTGGTARSGGSSVSRPSPARKLR